MTPKKIWNFEKYGSQVALSDDVGEKMTYKQIMDFSKVFARVIGRRCLVFIFCENKIGAVLGYIGTLNEGSVPVMLNAGLDKDMVRHLMAVYSPAFLWAPKGEEGKYGCRCVYDAYGYCLLETGDRMEYPLFEDLALLLTTSGSTGSPKFVRQSYQNIRANTDSIIRYLKIDSSERPITTLPMNYTYGLSVINTHLAVGATILLTDKGLMQKEFWDFLKEENATSFGGVPYTYEMLDKLRFDRMELPSLRTLTQAGGKLTLGLHEKFAKYAQTAGKKFVVMYGQCEATARMGYLPAEKALEKKGSMGISIPGGRFWLMDADGREITEPYTTGELVYEGANVTLGYAQEGNDLIKGDERNGKLVTGDMAQFDEEGYFYIVGRKKRFLKIYGNRVNLDEMERLIKSKYSIDAACAGMDDHLYIFLTDASFADDVRGYAAKKTKLNPAAFHIKKIREIPKNDSGKIQYKAFSRYYNDI